MSLSLEGKPGKKAIQEKKHAQIRCFGICEYSCAERGSLGQGCGGAGGHAASMGRFLPQFLPTQLITFEFPHANSTSDKKRCLHLSQGDPGAPQSILVL